MAGIRSLLGHRGEDGYRHLPDPDMVHLYFISHHGFTADHLLYSRVLDEHQTLYFFCPQKSREISLTRIIGCVFSYLTEDGPLSNPFQCVDSLTEEPGLIKDQLFTDKITAIVPV
jgi:hypothetical protein